MPDRLWLSACALDCSACDIHLRDAETLAWFQQRGVDPDLVRCNGCRTDSQQCQWSGDCAIRACCLEERHLLWCAQCPDLPCAKLTAWAGEYEHHARALARLQEMRSTGIEAWFAAHGWD